MGKTEAASAALAKAKREHVQQVLEEWLGKIAQPLGWTDGWFEGFWDEGRYAADGIIEGMKTPPEVTLEGCPVAQAALGAFRSFYAAVREPADLRTLKADQQVLRAAIEAIREHARIVER